MFSDQMKSLTEDIETAYETRKAEVFARAKETRQSLGNLQRERAKMTRDLRRSLSSNKVQRTKQVQKMRAAHTTSLQDMSRASAAFLSAAEEARMQEFATLIGEIQDGIAALEHDTATMLAGFRSERKAITRDLQARLARETRERAEQTRTQLSLLSAERQEMASTLRSELSSFQRDLSQSVAEMMSGFSTDHQQARAHWNDLVTTMSAKRAG